PGLHLRARRRGQLAVGVGGDLLRRRAARRDDPVGRHNVIRSLKYARSFWRAENRRLITLAMEGPMAPATSRELRPASADRADALRWGPASVARARASSRRRSARLNP